MLPDAVTIRLDAINDLLSVLPTVQAEYDPESFCGVLRAVVGAAGSRWSTGRRAGTRRRTAYSIRTNCHSSKMGGMSLGMPLRGRNTDVRGPASAIPLRDGRDIRPSSRLPRRGLHEGELSRALRGDGAHDVVLRFGPQAAGWIREKTWHPSQALEEQSDGSVIVRFHVNELRTVRRWVMWGSDCEAMEPQELRDLVAQEAPRSFVARNGEQQASRRPGSHQEKVGRNESAATQNPTRVIRLSLLHQRFEDYEY